MPTVDPPAILIYGETRVTLSARRRGGQSGDGVFVALAREVFLTNGGMGRGPVTRMDDYSYPIGPLCRALEDRLDEKNLAISD